MYPMIPSELSDEDKAFLQEKIAGLNNDEMAQLAEEMALLEK